MYSTRVGCVRGSCSCSLDFYYVNMHATLHSVTWWLAAAPQAIYRTSELKHYHYEIFGAPERCGG